MATTSLPVLAGIASTVIFASSVLPMLVKARRTKDLTSYSLGNMLLANLGNAVYSIYVYSLPPGPIWVLHGFYLVSTGLMLVWRLRYGHEQVDPSLSNPGWMIRPTRADSVPP
jgi:uncharacterized protein with PQ loop repeat